jgi:hypothetical protein
MLMTTSPSWIATGCSPGGTMRVGFTNSSVSPRA